MHTIVTITGPSCAGKTTLVRRMISSGKFVEIISTTTRQPRPGEVDGVDYHFVTPQEFGKILMVESVNFSGCQYGTAKDDVESSLATGRIPVVILEPNGLHQYEDSEYNLFKVFVDGNLSTLVERMVRRLELDVIGSYVIGSYEPPSKKFDKTIQRLKSLIDFECPNWYNEADWDYTILNLENQVQLDYHFETILGECS